MRGILKGFVGAALLFSASAASAQDYTWTLSDFFFDKWGPLSSPVASYTDSEFGTTASGNFVLTKVGSGYILKSYNFTTTLGDAGLAAVYDSSITEDYTTNPVAFDSFIDMNDINEETRFRLVWPADSLIAEMNMDALGSEIELNGQASREYQVGGERRVNGTGDEVCSPFNPNDCIDATAGVLTLTNIQQLQVATPEPGTMAVLGAGLLGLFVARRRRAA